MCYCRIVGVIPPGHLSSFLFGGYGRFPSPISTPSLPSQTPYRFSTLFALLDNLLLSLCLSHRVRLPPLIWSTSEHSLVSPSLWKSLHAHHLPLHHPLHHHAHVFGFPAPSSVSLNSTCKRKICSICFKESESENERGG